MTSFLLGTVLFDVVLRPVMGSLRRVVSESADIASTAVTQDVVDLVLSKTDRIVRVDPKLGGLERKVRQVTSVPGDRCVSEVQDQYFLNLLKFGGF